MFDSPDAALLTLTEHFSRPRVEMLLGALEPVIAFEPVPGREIVIGGTRFGGRPDLPPGLDWPKPPPQPDPEAVAKRASPAASEELLAHYRLAPPFLFVAQIDLAEAATLGPAASGLPPEGRLLFFYDMLAGPYDGGWTAARVIWDRSGRGVLKPAALPPVLAEAAAKDRAARADWDDEAARRDKAGTNYDAPARPMRLKAEFRSPATESLEAADNPALSAALGIASGVREDEDFAQAYSDLLARSYDRFYGDANAGHRNQLLGSPLPEQSDPRYDAVALSEFGVQFLSPEDRRTRRSEIEAKARDWRLLFQVDVSDVMQDDLAEGTVYFLIRKDDLAGRRFDKVMAIYQQT